MLKKILAVLLICLFAAGTFGGCGNNGSGQTQTTQPATQAATVATTQAQTTAAAQALTDEYFQKAQNFEISWLTYPYGSGLPMSEGTVGQKLVENKFNVKLKMLPITWGEQEQCNLMFADGTIPDVYSAHNVMEFTKLASQGIIRPFTEEMVRSKAPTFAKQIDDIIGPTGWKSVTINGKLYGLQRPWYSGNGSSDMMAIRKDWLDNVGITKLPETINDLEVICDKFTNGDPDKNGKKDTYALSGSYYKSFQYVFGAFGAVAPDDVTIDWTIKNDKVSFSPVTTGYKDALKVLAAWFKKGYIDPEVVITSTKRDQYREKWVNGKFGILEDDPWWMATDAIQSQGPAAMVMQKDPKANVVCFNAPKGPNGDSGVYRYPAILGDIIVFGKDVTDEKLARILEMIQVENTDEKLKMQLYYGEEGKDWSVVNGLYTVNPKVTNEMYNKEIGSMGVSLVDVDMDLWKKMNSAAAMIPYQVDANNPTLPIFTYSNFGVSDTLTKRGTDMDTIVREYLWKAITGKVDIDGTWDGYVKNWMDAGGVKATQEVNDLYLKNK